MIHLAVRTTHHIQDNIIVGFIPVVSMTKPVRSLRMQLDVTYPKRTVYFNFALKKSGPASVFGKPGSITSTGCPEVVWSGIKGNILCFQT